VILSRRAVVVVVALAGLLLAQLAWGRGPIAASDDPAKAERLAMNPEKAALLERALRLRAEAHARAAGIEKPNPLSARPSPTPDPPPPTGLIEITPPFPASMYLFDERGWQDVQAGRRITAYAGALSADRAQGVVVIGVAALPTPRAVPDFTELTGNEPRFATFPTPTKDGAVRIVAAAGARLTLKTESGKSFVFDVAERAFVSG
jgi:hypothetical protein